MGFFKYRLQGCLVMFGIVAILVLAKTTRKSNLSTKKAQQRSIPNGS